MYLRGERGGRSSYHFAMMSDAAMKDAITETQSEIKSTSEQLNSLISQQGQRDERIEKTSAAVGDMALAFQNMMQRVNGTQTLEGRAPLAIESIQEK